MPSEWDMFPVLPQAPPAAPAAGAAGGWDQFPVASPPPTYAGRILPVSRNAQGQPQLDWSAGLPGMIYRAVTAPGDVYTGKTPILNNSSDIAGTYNPDLINRGLDLASLATPVNPAIRAGDRAIPGLLGATTVPSRVKKPTATELKQVGGGQFDAARATGLEINADPVAQHARDTLQGLASGFDGQPGIGATPKSAPKTFDILEQLANPPRGDFTTLQTVANLQSVHRGLSGLSREGGTEGLAAGIAARRIDDYLSTLGPDSLTATSGTGASPEYVSGLLGTANRNYAAAKRSNELTGELDRATTGILERAEDRAAAAYSGRNIGNAIRSRVESFLERPKEVQSFSDDELDALRNVVRGGYLRNSARYLGNLLGGGGGLGAAITAGGTAALTSGEPLTGVMAGAAPVAIGFTAKSLDNALTKRALRQADELVRQRSPLYQQRLQQAPQVVPGLDARALYQRPLGVGTAQGLLPSVGPQTEEERRARIARGLLPAILGSP